MDITIKATLIVAAISGLGGALAGGLVTLLSQLLNRKWEKEDRIYEDRKKLYSEILSVASHMIGPDIFAKLNRDIGSALLICNHETRIPLVRYAASIEALNQNAEKISKEEKEICIQENINSHKFLTHVLRKEIGVD